MDDLRDLAAAYALDALDDDERAAFEAYMAERPDVQAEVATLRSGASGLARGAAASPPPGLRDAVLADIAATPQLTGEPGHVTEEEATPRSAVWLFAAAAVVALVVSVLGIVALTRGPTVGDVVAASDAVTVPFESPDLTASFTFSRSLGAGVFAGTLPNVATDQTYELWLIGSAGPEPAGLFRPGIGGAAEVVVEGRLDAGVAVGLTVEPAGGSSEPTGEILLLATLP